MSSNPKSTFLVRSVLIETFSGQMFSKKWSTISAVSVFLLLAEQLVSSAGDIFAIMISVNYYESVSICVVTA